MTTTTRSALKGLEKMREEGASLEEQDEFRATHVEDLSVELAKRSREANAKFLEVLPQLRAAWEEREACVREWTALKKHLPETKPLKLNRLDLTREEREEAILRKELNGFLGGARDAVSAVILLEGRLPAPIPYSISPLSEELESAKAPAAA